VAISQTMRLIVLVELIPILALFIGHPPSMPPAAPAASDGMLVDIVLQLLCGLALALLLQAFKVAGGWMLGGLASTAALILLGVVETRLPFSIVLPFVIVFAGVTGSRFRPGDLALLPVILKPASVAFAMAMALSVFFAG